ncbi:hypothetical protein ZWY2020_002887 [Hordeum vulgare]|nr:hypothetical protein ZWY2020_002887 [Hordeum vulgare]
MATTPPVGSPLSASPAAQSTPDPGLATGVSAKGTPTPGPFSDGGVAAAQSKPEVPGDHPISHDSVPRPPVSNA